MSKCTVLLPENNESFLNCDLVLRPPEQNAFVFFFSQADTSVTPN